MATHRLDVHRTVATPGRGMDDSRRARVDAALLLAVGAILLAIFLLPVVTHDHAFPVGPDVPVYLWWARVATTEGISLVGARPGTPALLPTVGAAIGLSPVEALAGLQYAMGPAIGLAAAALLRGRRDVSRPVWVTGAVLTTIWATHLGDGYLANLVFAACFLAAAASLARRSPRGTAAAAILLGAGGLAHPSFFAVGALILLLTAAWSLHDHGLGWRTDAGRIGVALGAGAVIGGVGLLASLAGPPRLSGDTSKDAYLRRIGELTTLRRTYLERFRLHWTRYAAWVTVPLAVAGVVRSAGFLRRFLVSWAVFTVVACVGAALTRLFPPDRVITFAFCVPLLVAFGFAWLTSALGGRSPRPWLVWPVVGLIGLLVVTPPLRAWISSPDFVDATEMRNALVAGRIAATTEPGTPLVFVANDLDTNGLFHMAHVSNVARAAVPADRADDVRVFVGRATDLLDGRSSVRGVQNLDAASARSLAELPDEPWAIFVVAGLDDDAAELDDPRLTRWHDAVATNIPDPEPLPALDHEPTPSSPGAMVAATLGTLVLLTAVGLGWGRWAVEDVPSALAVAPALGAATLTIVALALERIGGPFASPAGAASAVVLAGVSGYALMLTRLARERRGRTTVVLEADTGPES